MYEPFQLYASSTTWVAAAALVFCFLLVGVVVDYAKMLYLRSRMPPGPLPLPIIGNVLQLPKQKPWIRFEEWSKKYNDPLITVWIGRSPKIVVNDAWAASELMDKRANIYSSRPVFQMSGRVQQGDKWAQTLLPYGDQWRSLRKLTVRFLSSTTNCLAYCCGGASRPRSSLLPI
jgi:Cytochrome P450